MAGGADVTMITVLGWCLSLGLPLLWPVWFILDLGAGLIGVLFTLCVWVLVWATSSKAPWRERRRVAGWLDHDDARRAGVPLSHVERALQRVLSSREAGYVDITPVRADVEALASVADRIERIRACEVSPETAREHVARAQDSVLEASQRVMDFALVAHRNTVAAREAWARDVLTGEDTADVLPRNMLRLQGQGGDPDE